MSNNYWFLSIVTPLLFITFFQYVVVSPWNCQGLCCFFSNKCKEDVPFEGTFEKEFEPVVNTLRKSIIEGWDLGASLHVILDQKSVVDVAGGYQDLEKSKVYDLKTTNVIFSCGKVIETIAVALLVDKGVLDIEKPISEYWPEYAQQGKSDITMKDVLSHRSGSSYSFDFVPSLDILQSPERRDEFVAKQKYIYPKHTISYRAWSSAFIADAVCRRVDPKKRNLVQLVKDELFDNEDIFFSPPVEKRETSDYSISKVHDPTFLTLMFGLMPQIFLHAIYDKILPAHHPFKMRASDLDIVKSMILKTKYPDGYSYFDLPGLPDLGDAALSFNNESSFLSYNMMSGNSISNAKAISKALDKFMSQKVVGKKTFDQFMTTLPMGYDRLLMLNITHTIGGWGVFPDQDHYLVHPIEGLDNCTGWFGIGGSTLLHCKIRGKDGKMHNATFAYVMNAMSPVIRISRALNLLKELVYVVTKM